MVIHSLRRLNRTVCFKKWESTPNGVDVGFYSGFGVKPSSVSARCGKTGSTAALGNCRFISGSKLASDPTFQTRAFDWCFLLLCGYVYVIAVHNTGRAILLWGPSKKEKSLKTALVYIAMQWQFLMMVFQQELEAVWKIFLFSSQVRTWEWPCQLRPGCVLPATLCPTMATSRCPGKRKKRARASGASLACFPASSCPGQYGLLSNPGQVSLAAVETLGEWQPLISCTRSCPAAAPGCVR